MTYNGSGDMRNSNILFSIEIIQLMPKVFDENTHQRNLYNNPIKKNRFIVGQSKQKSCLIEV